MSVAPFALEENTEVFQLITVAVHHLLEPLGVDLFPSRDGNVMSQFGVRADEFMVF